MKRKLLVADLFAGAGGTSTGAIKAISALGYDVELVAVNHWDVAVATHTVNHPEARHHCVDLDAARPLDLVPEGKLDLLWASPSCTEHSYSKGGRAIDDQKRATAWCVVRWAETLLPRRIIVENVSQFTKWGPLDWKRRPVASRRGEIFEAWIGALRALGYRVEWNVLNAADFGVPQTRQRLFVQARRDRRKVVWPVPTHGRLGKPWRAAREIIDWQYPIESIFERDRPLAENTMKRIEEGIRRFCAPGLAEAFLVVLRQHMSAQSLGDPVPTVAAGGMHLGLAEVDIRPFVCANRTNNVPGAIDGPVPPVTTSGGLFLVEPHAFVLGQNGGSSPRAVERPLPTVAQDGAISLVEPYIVEVNHSGERNARSTGDPLPTVTTKNGLGVVEPFIVSYHGESNGGEHRPRSLDEPLPTVVTANRFGMVEPFLTAHFGEREGQAPRVHPIDKPAPTVTHRGAGDLVVPVLEPATEAAPRGRVIEIDGALYVLDVRFRMLQPRELARAQTFPDSYEFTGNKSETTAQIGNAVPVELAAALVTASFSDEVRVEGSAA